MKLNELSSPLFFLLVIPKLINESLSSLRRVGDRGKDLRIHNLDMDGYEYQFDVSASFTPAKKARVPIGKKETELALVYHLSG
jgi:hypothetical protein